MGKFNFTISNQYPTSTGPGRTRRYTFASEEKEKQSKPPYWVTDCSYDIKFEYSYEEARTKV